jgi:wyosine [tRNA(Phe)-imidazoG37] synthetase (radical SAM superfamily)
VRGLETFRAAYPGKLWVEVMLVRGVNDTDKAMADLARVLDLVRPDDVHVTRPVRPPAEGWVEPPSDEAVARFAAALGRRAHVVPRQAPITDLSEHGDIHEAVLAILKRHPMSVGDLRDALSRWDPRQVDAALAHLREAEAVRQIQRLGQTFWAAAEARYGWPPPARPEGGDRSE